jgi:hypothetical protein
LFDLDVLYCTGGARVPRTPLEAQRKEEKERREMRKKREEEE